MISNGKYIYKCPSCGNILSRRSLGSGNTFLARFFSDNKTIAPMLPRVTNLTRCKKCHGFLWLDKLEDRGFYQYGDDRVLSCKYADEAEFLGIEDCYDALEAQIAENKAEEYNIRQELWWGYNDKIRNNQEIFIDENDELRWKDNCIKLLSLLNYSDTRQRMLMAEINRNLGNFEKCISIINTIDKNDSVWIKEMREKLPTECERQNRWVIELTC